MCFPLVLREARKKGPRFGDERGLDFLAWRTSTPMFRSPNIISARTVSGGIVAQEPRSDPVERSCPGKRVRHDAGAIPNHLADDPLDAARRYATGIVNRRPNVVGRFTVANEISSALPNSPF
jgi:hypothetical protein